MKRHIALDARGEAECRPADARPLQAAAPRQQPRWQPTHSSLLVLHLVADVVVQDDDGALLELPARHQLGELGGQHTRVAVLAVRQQHTEALGRNALRILQSLDACAAREHGA